MLIRHLPCTDYLDWIPSIPYSPWITARYDYRVQSQEQSLSIIHCDPNMLPNCLHVLWGVVTTYKVTSLEIKNVLGCCAQSSVFPPNGCNNSPEPICLFFFYNLALILLHLALKSNGVAAKV